jgi:tRNA A37 threonylcarbamoyladenosine biosynthesis protein TsaE
LSNLAEAEDLDIDAMLSHGPLVVEWADRIRPALPGEALTASLKYIDDSQRDLMFMAHGKRYQSLLAALRKKVFGG